MQTGTDAHTGYRRTTTDRTSVESSEWQAWCMHSRRMKTTRDVCVCVYRPEQRDVHTDASSSSTPFIVCEHAEEERCAYLCVCVLPSTNGRLLLQGHTGNSAIVATTTNTVNFSIKLFVLIYKNVSSTTAPFKYLWQ